MDENEARAIISRYLAAYRGKTYNELRRLLREQDCFETHGPSGVWYQIEIQAITDDARRRTIRVCGAIDDGGPRAYRPLTDDFIMAPDGAFVGEQGAPRDGMAGKRCRTVAPES